MFHRCFGGACRLTAALLALSVLAPAASADLSPIQLDGFFGDWADITPQYMDAAGDGGTVDFGNVAVANDQDYLYIRFEVTGDVQPDEQQNMELYLDTDMNAATGTAFGGIGAELTWKFGVRSGTFKPAATSYTVAHDNIGLMMGPTFSNNQFEVALKRNIIPGGTSVLMANPTVRFILRDATSGDLAPNAGSISYTFVAGSDVPPTTPMARESAGHIRIASWNILSDGIFTAAKQPAQNRILDAINPDVLLFCEVFNHTAAQVKTQVEVFLPSGAGQTWYTAKVDAANVVCSRYPITQTWLIGSTTSYRESAFLIDLGASQAKDLLFIAAHLRCCTDDASRQVECDRIISFIRDARTAGGVINLPQDTPIVIAGDMNFVGWRQQYDTLLNGDIVDNATYGADYPPDWDGTSLAVPPSRHPTAAPATPGAATPAATTRACWTGSSMRTAR